MPTDQPTAPDLGNITDAAFLALPDWSVIATNILGKDDTFASMETCVIALFYRVLRDNMRYINDAFACRVDTPLSLAAKATSDSTHWLETDHPCKGLIDADFGGLSPIPDIIFDLNGHNVDDVGGVLKMNNGGPGTDIAYAVVAVTGSSTVPQMILGARTHANRWLYSDDTPLVKTEQIAFQASFHIPEWPQDTVENIVLAKVADYTSPIDVGGLNRIGFEFGLGLSDVVNPDYQPRDYILYLRWYSSFDNVIDGVAKTPITGQRPALMPISITPGRRITLGFHRYLNSSTYEVKFYINGVFVAIDQGLGGPDVSASSDIRLILGSAQLGKSYTGGPVNNACVWSNVDINVDMDGTMLGAYRRGEGFESAP